MDDLERTRTARHLNLPGFGAEQQRRLHESRVLVVGAGGLGSPAMQTLAAVGVGTIDLYDDDTVGLTNIHRQILFGVDDVGRDKIEVAAEKLRALQPGITVNTYRTRLNANNILAALDGVDLILDGSDTFDTKYLVADAAEITGTPLIWGTVLRYRGDIALWHSGPGAPADSPGLRDLFPSQPAGDSVPDCATAGVLGVTTSVVGNLMSTEAVKYLAGIGESVPGKMISYDALGSSMRSFTVARDPSREAVTELAAAAAATGPDPEARRLLALLEQAEATALDIREDHEKLLGDIEATRNTHLPLSGADDAGVEKLFSRLSGTVVAYCASGTRSGRFVERYADSARARGIELHSLPGGVNAV